MGFVFGTILSIEMLKSKSKVLFNTFFVKKTIKYLIFLIFAYTYIFSYFQKLISLNQINIFQCSNRIFFAFVLKFSQNSFRKITAKCVLLRMARYLKNWIALKKINQIEKAGKILKFSKVILICLNLNFFSHFFPKFSSINFAYSPCMRKLTNVLENLIHEHWSKFSKKLMKFFNNLS